jgi:hypothetical protein
MFYVQSIVIPLIIVFMAYLIKQVERNFRGHIIVLCSALPYIYLYTALLYFLQIEHISPTGWAFNSIMFFLVPSTVILLVIRLVHWFNKVVPR